MTEGDEMIGGGTGSAGAGDAIWSAVLLPDCVWSSSGPAGIALENGMLVATSEAWGALEPSGEAESMDIDRSGPDALRAMAAFPAAIAAGER